MSEYTNFLADRLNRKRREYDEELESLLIYVKNHAGKGGMFEENAIERLKNMMKTRIEIETLEPLAQMAERFDK